MGIIFSTCTPKNARCDAISRKANCFDPSSQSLYGRIPFTLNESEVEPCHFGNADRVPAALDLQGSVVLDDLIHQWMEEQDKQQLQFSKEPALEEEALMPTFAQVLQPEIQEAQCHTTREDVENGNGTKAAKRPFQTILDELHLLTSKIPRIDDNCCPSNMQKEAVEMEESNTLCPPSDKTSNCLSETGTSFKKRHSNIKFSSENHQMWIHRKEPLNLTNSSHHSLPFYRAAPSCRRTYSKSIFEKMAVIKQVDRKFICCVAEQDGKQHLILIDQHAAHERVCLEKLIQSGLLLFFQSFLFHFNHFYLYFCSPFNH